ncbi:phage tail protein [Maricaulis sp. D1M11]|uniref:phage tail protein n=1 Tax=Maricaulis sp. D1M11 TaxID=3076117 RepID=UPI0039B612C9
MKLKMMASVALVTGLAFGSSAHAGPNPFIGEVQLTAGTFCPRDFAPTDGQLQSISSNPTLFSIIGNMYDGDARTTMGIPDLRGRTAVNYLQGIGLYQIPLGFEWGSPQYYINHFQMPAHSHGVAVTSSANTDPQPNNRLLATYGGGGRYYYGANPSTVVMNTLTSTEGSGLPHTAVQPTLAIRHCIALDGIYPPRN